MLSNKKLLFPASLSQEEYEKVRTYLLNILGQYQDVVALYEFGNVKNLGISDLDFAIVYKDEPTDRRIGEKIGQIKFSHTAEKIFCGSTLMVFPERTFSSIMMWDDLRLTHRFGTTFEFTTFPPEVDKLLNICRILDWLPERIMSLIRALQQDTIVVNHILGLLYSLRYTLYKVQDLKIYGREKIAQFDEAITELREGWFTLYEEQQRDKLAQAVQQAISLACACTVRSTQWLEKEGYYRYDEDAIKSGTKFSFSSKYGYTFEKNALQLNWHALLNKDRALGVWLPVPALWAFHLREYAEVDGVISKKLQNAFTPYPMHGAIIAPKLLELLGKRIMLVNEWAEFLYTYHFQKGLFKFGWFY